MFGLVWCILVFIIWVFDIEQIHEDDENYEAGGENTIEIEEYLTLVRLSHPLAEKVTNSLDLFKSFSRNANLSLLWHELGYVVELDDRRSQFNQKILKLPHLSHFHVSVLRARESLSTCM